ncbi:MAG TPA: tetratricopeptide repeat protein, partial [Nitrospirota bacterium]
QGRDKSGPAEEMFARAISLKSSDADAHFYRGYNLSALERYEEAADEFRQALKLNPEMQKAKGQLEVAGKFASEAAIKEADEMMGRGEYKTAELKFRKALLLDPSSPEAKKGAKEASEALTKDTAERIARVRAALGKAEFAKARDEAKELARLNPGPDSEAVNREVREETAQAVKELMAQADEAEGREALSEAIFVCEKAVLLDPSNGAHTEMLRRLRGKIAEESARAKDALKDGKLAAAKKSYEKLVRYDSGDADAKAGLASVNARIEQETAKAIARAHESIASGDIEKAVAQINRALEYSPQDADALALRRKIAQKASEVAAPAAVVDEQEVRRVYLQGVEHYTKGELAEAIASWREVLKLDPKNEKASSNIARAEDKLKEASGKGVK